MVGDWRRVRTGAGRAFVDESCLGKVERGMGQGRGVG